MGSVAMTIYYKRRTLEGVKPTHKRVLICHKKTFSIQPKISRTCRVHSNGSNYSYGASQSRFCAPLNPDCSVRARIVSIRHPSNELLQMPEDKDGSPHEYL